MSQYCRDSQVSHEGAKRTEQTMQASLPPSSIWMGIMPAFLQMLMPVSPPVKLRENSDHVSCIELLYALLQQPRSKKSYV